MNQGQQETCNFIKQILYEFTELTWLYSVSISRDNEKNQYHDLVVDILPIIQSNQLKGGEHRPQEIIKVRVTVIWIRANAETGIVLVAVSVNTRMVQDLVDIAISIIAARMLPILCDMIECSTYCYTYVCTRT